MGSYGPIVKRIMAEDGGNVALVPARGKRVRFADDGDGEIMADMLRELK
jgi:hypothetical protein